MERSVTTSIAPSRHWGALWRRYFGKFADEKTGDVLGMQADGAGGLTTGGGFAGRVVDDQTGRPIPQFRVEIISDDPQNPRAQFGNVFFGGRFGFEGNALGTLGGGGIYWNGPPLFAPGEKVRAQVRADGYLTEPVTPEPVVWPVKLTNLVVRLRRAGATAQPAAPSGGGGGEEAPTSTPPTPPSRTNQTNPATDPVNSTTPAANPSGITLEIRCATNVFKVGDEIPIEFVISNHGTTDYTYANRDYDRRTRMGEYKLVARTSAGGDVPDPGSSIMNGTLFGLTKLGPGQSFTKIVPLNRWALLKEPGRYVVTGTYLGADYTAEKPTGAPIAPANSDSITITLLPRTKEEMGEYIKGLTNELAARLATHDSGAFDAPLEEAMMKLMYTSQYPELFQLCSVRV